MEQIEQARAPRVVRRVGDGDAQRAQMFMRGRPLFRRAQNGDLCDSGVTQDLGRLDDAGIVAFDEHDVTADRPRPPWQILEKTHADLRALLYPSFTTLSPPLQRGFERRRSKTLKSL